MDTITTPDPTSAPPLATLPKLSPGKRATTTRALDRDGRVQVSEGVSLVRPCPDRSPDAPELPTPKHLTQTELQALHVHSRPLAKMKARATQIAEEVAGVIADAGSRARFEALREEAAQLERQAHGDGRAAARVACLDALKAMRRRKAAQYTAAVNMLADAASEYEAVCRLGDEMLGRSTFDQLGNWRNDAGIIAPHVEDRPRGWTVAVEHFREYAWSPRSEAHARAVERAKREILDEAQGALNGAGWPFP